MTRLPIAAFDTGKGPTPLCNTNQHKMQQSDGAQGKYIQQQFLNAIKR